jgi:hypothetical protein
MCGYYKEGWVVFLKKSLYLLSFNYEFTLPRLLTQFLPFQGTTISFSDVLTLLSQE